MLGAEASYGAKSRARDSREVLLRLVVEHPQREALDMFAREIGSVGTELGAGHDRHFRRAAEASSRWCKLFTFLIDKGALPAPQVQIGEERAVRCRGADARRLCADARNLRRFGRG